MWKKCLQLKPNLIVHLWRLMIKYYQLHLFWKFTPFYSAIFYSINNSLAFHYLVYYKLAKLFNSYIQEIFLLNSFLRCRCICFAFILGAAIYTNHVECDQFDCFVIDAFNFGWSCTKHLHTNYRQVDSMKSIKFLLSCAFLRSCLVPWIYKFSLSFFFLVTYYLYALYFTCTSLLALTLRCFFNEYNPNIGLFTQIASSNFAQLILCTDAVDVSKSFSFTFLFISRFYFWFLFLTNFALQTFDYKDVEDEFASDFSKVVDRLLFFVLLFIFFIGIIVGY